MVPCEASILEVMGCPDVNLFVEENVRKTTLFVNNDDNRLGNNNFGRAELLAATLCVRLSERLTISKIRMDIRRTMRYAHGSACVMLQELQ